MGSWTLRQLDALKHRTASARDSLRIPWTTHDLERAPQISKLMTDRIDVLCLNDADPTNNMYWHSEPASVSLPPNPGLGPGTIPGSVGELD